MNDQEKNDLRWSEPIETIVTDLLIRDEDLEKMRALLTVHDVELTVRKNGCVLCLPPGSYRMELFPRTRMIRHTVFLPDGWSFFEQVIDQDNVLSRVAFNLSDVPAMV